MALTGKQKRIRDKQLSQLQYKLNLKICVEEATDERLNAVAAVTEVNVKELKEVTQYQEEVLDYEKSF